MYKVEDLKNHIFLGDARELLKNFPSNSIDMVITSPPYWNLRDYNIENQIGQEKYISEYILELINIFNEVHRVLKDTGSCWVNIGDTYSKTNKEIPTKSLCCIPDKFKIEMVNRNWICRNEIIWYKPNAMPQPVKDRFTVDYEKLFFFTKSKKYYFEQQFEPYTSLEDLNSRLRNGKDIWKSPKAENNEYAIHGKNRSRESKYGDLSKGRNKRSVWKILSKGISDAHFAIFPNELIEIPISACCPPNGIVLDVFMGSGTVGLVSKSQGKNYCGVEINPAYIKIANKRINNVSEVI